MKLINACLFVGILSVVGCSSSTDSVIVNANDKIVADFVGTSPGGVDVLSKHNGALDRFTAGTGSSAGEALVSGRAFRVGSVSKAFIAVMVMQLVDENVVNLDASLADYLPDTLIGGAVTVRQLLSHKSGIPDYSDQPAFFLDLFADLGRPRPRVETLVYVVDVPAGLVGQFSYSNTNYILLGQLIEQLDKIDLNASLQARITGPLELYNTIFDDGTDNMMIPDSLVGGWSEESIYAGDPLAPYEAIASSAWAAGSLISTVDDLADFLGALVAGQLVSTDSFAQMIDTGDSGYGLGLQRIEFTTGEVFFGHGGTIPGYLSGVVINPTNGKTLVVLTNNEALKPEVLATEILSAQ